ncbi:MAG: dihydroxyacetone kinase subunit L [Streptosporangiales bacterium]|nr:dihydroxyacetone kinase subunit L [Streptosporangiales bacterium]
MAADGAAVRAWVRAFADAVTARKTELTELDSAIGDGDHGINMDRGMRAVVAKLDATEGAELGALLRAVGMTLVSKVGGASGPLYGTFFLEAGKSLGPSTEVGPADWAEAMAAAVAGVQSRGKAEAGDKTMVDALLPARDALFEAVDEGADLAAATIRAADAAEQGRDATEPLVARKGRASYLGERSAGHLDPGAVSAALLFRCAADTLSA